MTKGKMVLELLKYAKSAIKNFAQSVRPPLWSCDFQRRLLIPSISCILLKALWSLLYTLLLCNVISICKCHHRRQDMIWRGLQP